ncbi:hypothetical protein ABT095_13785 [Kitasatospora sp. NPDC002227]|uniref:hypothetical protein n=1 Tax=Kitasatospora sp. NPDC002227 TaxID=3154773 RepID=UPI003322E0F7
MEYRPGDVLRVSCPFTEAVVTRVMEYDVVLRWPWWEIDQETEWIEWNGEVALPLPEDPGWGREYFRTEPAEETLRPGDRCLVGIPPTVVHVLAVRCFDPPLETGWLPRPATYLEVLRQGESYDAGLEEQGYEIDPDGGVPYRLEPLFRPYAFLEPGDEVADAAGRAWRFEAPWGWQAFDGGPEQAPVWPLGLLHREGGATPEAVAAVAAATARGGHADEEARWVELTGAGQTERPDRERDGGTRIFNSGSTDGR